MKITPKGIGWLIFGVIVCASATEAIGLISALSTIALGLVFILIYVMKQFFKPRSLGWYILGGIMLAFSIESGLNSDTLIAAVIAFASLLWFYYRNKNDLDSVFSGMVTDEIEDFGYLDEDTYPDPVVFETVEEVVEETFEDAAAETGEPAEEAAYESVVTEITTTDEDIESEAAAATKSKKTASTKSGEVSKSKKADSAKPRLQTFPPEGPEEGIIEDDMPAK